MTSRSDEGTVELTFPASSRFIRLTRLAAATLAAEMDFHVEAVDDVRIAVDELVTLLVEGDHRGTVTIAFRPEGDTLVVDGSCEGDGVDPIDTTDLVDAILAATTDDHELESRPGFRRFSITKRRESADGFGDDELDDGDQTDLA